MTIQEIKDLYGIDLREKTRKELVVTFRTLFVHDNAKLTNSELGEILGLDRTTIINLRKKIVKDKNKKYYRFIKSLYYSKKPNVIKMYEDYKNEYMRVKKLRYSGYIVEDMRDTNRVQKPIEKPCKPMISLFRVCDILRPNLNHDLNFKDYNKFTETDYNEIRNLNPEYFDKHLIN